MLYNALVVPHHSYCDTVWAMAIRSSLKRKWESIQNAAARFIKGCGLLVSSAGLKRDLGWVSLEDKRKIHYLSTVWQCLHGRSPIYLKKMVASTDSLHSYNTRSRLVVPRFRRSFAARCSFSLHAPSLYNGIPRSVKMADTMDVFRSRLHAHLLGQV